MHNQKGSAVIPLVVVLVVVLAGTLVYFAYFRKPSEVATSPTPTATVNPTANWKTYQNEKYGLVFRYPAEWGTIEAKTEGPENLVTEDNKDCKARGFIFRSNATTATQGQVLSFLTHSVDYVGCNPGRGGGYFDVTSIKEEDGKLNYDIGSPDRIEKTVLTQNGSKAYIIKDVSWDKSEKDAFAVGFVNPPDNRFAVLILEVPAVAAPSFEGRKQILEGVLSSLKFSAVP